MDTANNDDYAVDEDEDYTLDDISDDITAAADLIDDRLRRIEENTATTAKWLTRLSLAMFILLFLNFIAFLIR